ncbi:BF3164 family lipoprotein [Filimonas effusa]|uniref:6-bladed beta-propeller n=1 Tax=Filimonas effusa TaxID=2508721 RepID=A0A4V1MA43_9BACT|nr:BF3164 family lipoprotein [Filimonas effusa]RXK83874.1 hypothetical protein ESB13_17545 [Filimonas effusa]
MAFPRYVIVALLFIAFSCKQPPEHRVFKLVDDHFESRLERNALNLPGAERIVDMVVIPSSNLLLISVFKDDYLLNAYSLDSLKFIRAFAKVGDKFNEQFDAQNFQVDTAGNILIVADLIKKEIFSYSLDSIRSKSNTCYPVRSLKIKSEQLGRPLLLRDGRVAALRGPYTRSKSNFDFYDSNGSFLVTKGEYPLSVDGFSEQELSEVFLGFLALTRDGKRILRSYLSTDVIDVYDTSGMLLHRVQGPGAFEPKFKRKQVEKNISRLAFTNHSRVAYIGSMRENKDIFSLYSGSSTKVDTVQSNRIFRFSDTLGLKGIYNLGIPLICFDIDFTNKKIYGFSEREPGKISLFNLPQ